MNAAEIVPGTVQIRAPQPLTRMRFGRLPGDVAEGAAQARPVLPDHRNLYPLTGQARPCGFGLGWPPQTGQLRRSAALSVLYAHRAAQRP